MIYGFNFLPETGIERNLGLRQKLHNRIQEIHDSIGEDSEILDRTEQLNEEAFRGPITMAINRELNLLRWNGVASQELLKTLVRLYHQHNMRDWVDRRSLQLEDQPIPKIVCSEALA